MVKFKLLQHNGFLKSTYRLYDHDREPCHHREALRKSNKTLLHGRRFHLPQSFALAPSPPTRWRWTVAPVEGIQNRKLFKREDCGENKITPIGNRKPHLQKRIWKDDIPSPAHWKRPWSHPVHDRRIDAPLLRRSEQRWIRCCTVHVSSPARCFLQQWVAQLSSLGLRCPHKLWTETVHTQKQKKKDKEALKKKKSCKKKTK